MLEQERVREQTKAPDAITGAMTWLLRWVGRQNRASDHAHVQESTVHIDGATEEHVTRGGRGFGQYDLGLWREPEAVSWMGGQADLSGEQRCDTKEMSLKPTPPTFAIHRPPFAP